MQCKACGAEITSKKEPCPQCGHKEKSKALWLLLLLIPAVLLVVALVVGVIILILGIAGVSLFMVNADKAVEVYHPTEPSAYVEFMPDATAPTFVIETVPTEPPLNMHNPYIAILPDRDGYFLPNSSIQYLTGNDLRHLTEQELVLARNEIFARKGYIFTDTELSEYFLSKNWYQPSISANEFNASYLNNIELANVKFLSLYEERSKGVAFSSDNPYAQYYYYSDYYYFPSSDVLPIYDNELSGLTVEELRIAQNEILARHGYTFEDRHLLEYFLQMTWYVPAAPVENTSTPFLSSMEQENMDKLRQQEENLEKYGNLNTEFNYVINCDYYYLTAPAYWAEYGYVSTYGGSIVFREYASYQDGYGGHLFSLHLYSSASEYMYLPNYRVLGYLTDRDGVTWHLVAQFPTDVQFSPGNEMIYGKMYEIMEDVLDTLDALPGCTLSSY